MDPAAALKDQIFRLVTSVHRIAFTASGGRVLGRLGGMPVLLLETTGRTSGALRTTMLTSPVQDGDTVVLVASYGGDPRHPAWYRNLEANPDVAIVMGGKKRRMRARVASPEEKEALWPRITKAYRGYGAYQRRTERDIPVVILEPR